MLWGFYYGVLLLAEKLVLKKVLDKMPKFLTWIYSMFFVLIGWVIFNQSDMTQLANTLKMMFNFTPTNISAAIMQDTNILLAVLYIPLGILCMLPWKNWIKLPDNTAVQSIKYLACIALFFVSVIFIISSSYNPFIYFRF